MSKIGSWKSVVKSPREERGQILESDGNPILILQKTRKRLFYKVMKYSFYLLLFLELHFEWLGVKILDSQILRFPGFHPPHFSSLLEASSAFEVMLEKLHKL